MTAKSDSKRLDDPVPQAPALTPQERRAREEAMRFANASLALSGFKMSAEAQSRADRFVAGEIDLADFINGQ